MTELQKSNLKIVSLVFAMGFLIGFYVGQKKGFQEGVDLVTQPHVVGITPGAGWKKSEDPEIINAVTDTPHGLGPWPKDADWKETHKHKPPIFKSEVSPEVWEKIKQNESINSKWNEWKGPLK